MKRIFALTVCFMLLFSCAAHGAEPSLSAESAVLMCADTGDVLFEKNKDLALPPASVTKIMTMLLVMEEIEKGNLKYDDVVTASDRAKSMGGSTIFLDSGEKMTVHDLLKGVAVASANDACVALAEHISGSVEDFVEKMNARANELGMKNTCFKNTNGLDSDGHVSSAYDIALMSRELMRHKDIFGFTKIWTDSLRNGEFLLANTNKLIRFYDGATGLKTGSTSKAGCCISATAERGGLNLIAVVMNAPDSKTRFADARTLLDFGFAKYSVWRYEDTESAVGTVRVKKGMEKTAVAVPESAVSALIKKGAGEVEMKTELYEEVASPVKKDDRLGTLSFYLGDEKISECALVAKSDVERITFGRVYLNFLKQLAFNSEGEAPVSRLNALEK